MNKILILFLLTMFLSFAFGRSAIAEDYLKKIEILEADISVDHNELPYIAYLSAKIANNGEKQVSNITIELKYYNKEDLVIHKRIIKNALKEPILPGGTKEYYIRLRRDYINKENEQFPYSSQEKLGDFDVKIISARCK